jgi:hypothetical protein
VIIAIPLCSHTFEHPGDRDQSLQRVATCVTAGDEDGDVSLLWVSKHRSRAAASAVKGLAQRGVPSIDYGGGRDAGALVISCLLSPTLL